jgi:hypothetical protein
MARISKTSSDKDALRQIGHIDLIRGFPNFYREGGRGRQGDKFKPAAFSTSGMNNWDEVGLI